VPRRRENCKDHHRKKSPLNFCGYFRSADASKLFVSLHEEFAMKQKKYFPTRAFVDLINERWGIGLTVSRLHKDRMSKDKDGHPRPPVAPEPAARFGNRDLFTEEQAPPYVAKLIDQREPEQGEVA
jgi:hypothetical protein